MYAQGFLLKRESLMKTMITGFVLSYEVILVWRDLLKIPEIKSAMKCDEFEFCYFLN